VAVDDADAHGDVHQECGPDADQDVRAEAGGFSRQLALESDDAAEQDGESQLDEEIDTQDARDLQDVRQVDVGRGLDENGGLPPAARLSLPEVAHVADGRVRRAVAVRHAARLRLERIDRRFVGLGGGREGPEHGAPALLAGYRCRNIVGEKPLLTAREAYQCHHASGTVFRHRALTV
jgi:hypothetical protein